MQKKHEALISVLRSTLTGERPALDGVDVQALILEASAQAVIIQVCATLSDAGGSWKQLQDRMLRQFATNVRVGCAQNELVKLLEQNGFSYVILKGESAAAYYPKPELRSLGDVDFLIDPAEQNLVERALLDAGYEKSHDGHVCHVVFKKRNAHLEMHFEPAGIPDGEIGVKVRAFLRDAVFRYTRKDIGSGPFRATGDKFHALILLLHMQHHLLGEGIGLRHLCDWAYFVNATWNSAFWQDVIPFLNEIGLARFAATMTEICVKYLGAKGPNFGIQTEDALCDAVMEDVFEGGNFGKKDSARSESFILISNRGKTGVDHGKLYYLFYALNAYVREHFYKFRKVYILYPVFYLCVGVKYLYCVASGRRMPFRRLISSANKRKKLFESLKVFKRE